MDQLQIELDAFPSAIRPMQAVAAEAPFSSDEYLFEVKWDGLRCVLFVEPDGGARVQDRGLNDLTPLLPELVAASKQVAPGTVLDGELVATAGVWPGAPSWRTRSRWHFWPSTPSTWRASPSSGCRSTGGARDCDAPSFRVATSTSPTTSRVRVWSCSRPAWSAGSRA